MSSKPPTAKQLAYLKALAQRTGRTFVTPQPSRDASREIRRLKQARPTPRRENQEIDPEIADAVAQGNADAARVRAHEVTGYGASATWSQRS